MEFGLTQYSGFNPRTIALTVVIVLALLFTFIPMNPVEQTIKSERTNTITVTKTDPDKVQLVTGVATVQKQWVVGWLETGYAYWWRGFYYHTGGRMQIDIFDHIEKYVKQPESSGRWTIILYKDGQVVDTIRDVSAMDLQYRTEDAVVTTTGPVTIPGRVYEITNREVYTETQTTTKMANVWAASGASTGIGAMISLVIIAGLVALAFMKPAPSRPPPPTQPAVYQPGPAHISAPPRMAAPATGKGVICFGCGSLIPSGASVCPRCGKQA